MGLCGDCFSIEVVAVLRQAATIGVHFENLKAAKGVKKQRIDRFLEKIGKALWVVKGKRVAILGLAFKANTDDIRFAPALDVMKRLLDEGAEVHACDPEALEKAKKQFPQAHYHQDPYKALEGVHAAWICSEWDV